MVAHPKNPTDFSRGSVKKRLIKKITDTKRPYTRIIKKQKGEDRICRFCGNFTSNSNAVCDSCAQDFSEYEY